MSFYVFLICNECKHTFSFEFTRGCMRTDKASIICPECNHDIQLVHTKTFQNGSVGIQVVGATRGLQLEFTSKGEPI